MIIGLSQHHGSTHVGRKYQSADIMKNAGLAPPQVVFFHSIALCMSMIEHLTGAAEMMLRHEHRHADLLIRRPPKIDGGVIDAVT